MSLIFTLFDDSIVYSGSQVEYSAILILKAILAI